MLKHCLNYSNPRSVKGLLNFYSLKPMYSQTNKCHKFDSNHKNNWSKLNFFGKQRGIWKQKTVKRKMVD